MIRSKPFVITMAVLCGVMVLVCIPLGLRFWGVFQGRRTFNHAVELFNAGKFDEALPLLDACIRRMPRRLKPYQMAATICARFQEPDYKRAEGYYESMIALAEGEEKQDARLRLAALCLRDRKDHKPEPDKAIPHLEAVLEKDAANVTAHAALGVAYALKGMHTRAREHVDRAWSGHSTQGEEMLARTARQWAIVDMLRRGEVLEASVAYRSLIHGGGGLRGSDHAHIALARAFRANDPGISISLRRFYVQGMSAVPLHFRTRYAVQLHTLVGAAWERLGSSVEALRHYRAAHKASPKSALTRRNLAYALFGAAARTRDPKQERALRNESLALYQQLIADKQLKDAERRQVALALASFAWNAGNEAEAQKLLAGMAIAGGALVERMAAAAAVRAGKYREAIAHLRQALKEDPKQPDVQAILQRLQTPPEIRDVRLNRRGPHDRRPIITAVVLPRSLPVPIPPDKVHMKLDGKPVKSIFTKVECFFLPPAELDAGEHTVEVSATDTLGLSASKSITFTIKEDKEPPDVVGISPAPDSAVGDKQPLITFRCTDASGIDPHSITVAIGGSVAGFSREITIVSRGVYQVNLPSVKITKGSPVRGGVARFKPSKPLLAGEYWIRVGVSDVHGNRRVKKWSFRRVD